MAVTETVKILFEADTKAITDTTKELTSMKKATEEDVAAFKKLSDTAKAASSSVEETGDKFVSLRAQVKQAKEEVQRMADEFGEFSTQANAARVKAGALVDQMDDMNRQLKLLNPEAKAQAFVNFGNQIVGAFQIATGALQAFGAENEQVAKLAMRLQGALNVAQGIASLKSLKEGFQDLKVVLGVTTAAQTTLNTAQTAGTATTGGLTNALKALRVALISNPFTAVAVAVGALAGAFLLLRDNTEEAKVESEDFIKKQKALANVTQELVRAEEDLAIAKDPSRKAEILKARAARDTTDALKDQVKENEEINKKIAENNRLNEDAAKRIEILKKSNREAAIFQIQGLQQAIDKRTKENESLTKTRDLNQDIIDESNKLLSTKQKQLDIENKIEKSIEKQAKAAAPRQKNIDLKLEPKPLDNAIQQLTDQINTALDEVQPKTVKIGETAYELNQQLFDKTDKLQQERAQAAQELFAASQDFIFSLSQSYYQREQQELEKQRDQGIITEEQYQEKLKKIKQNQARQDKELAIFAATVSLAEAIVKALTIKPPASFAAAAATAAIAGLNLAKIIATPLPKFKQGTLSVPGVDTGQDTVMAMLRPGEAVIPTETNREYAPALRAIYRRDINAKELNDFVTNREAGAFAFNQVSLDALYRRDLKVSAITAAGKTAQLTAQPTKITADVDVQQLTRAMSKNKAVEVTNTSALGEAIAAQLSKRINPRQVI